MDHLDRDASMACRLYRRVYGEVRDAVDRERHGSASGRRRFADLDAGTLVRRCTPEDRPRAEGVVHLAVEDALAGCWLRW